MQTQPAVDGGALPNYAPRSMTARLLIVFALVSSLLAGSVSSANCQPAKAAEADCQCCAPAEKSCCNMAAKPKCKIPPAPDRAAQPDFKPLASPLLFSVGEIRFFTPTIFFFHVAQNSAQIPSPPPLELNCIRLI